MAQKKTDVSKTVPMEPDKVATAAEPVQPDMIVTAMQSMILRKRITTQNKVEVRQKKKRQAGTSNDVDEETKVKDDLEKIMKTLLIFLMMLKRRIKL
jgi:hypothetical protein